MKIIALVCFATFLTGAALADTASPARSAPASTPPARDLAASGFTKTVWKSQHGETAPKFLSGYAPVYPIAYRRKRLDGNVTIHFTVDAAGRVKNPKVIQTSSVGLNPFCLEVISKWRFQPAELNGHPVATDLSVPFYFKINRGAPQ